MSWKYEGLLRYETDGNGKLVVYDGNNWVNAGEKVGNTDDIEEGTTNKYYSDTLVNNHLSGDSGVTYHNGLISIGQGVRPTDSPEFKALTLTHVAESSYGLIDFEHDFGNSSDYFGAPTGKKTLARIKANYYSASSGGELIFYTETDVNEQIFSERLRIKSTGNSSSNSNYNDQTILKFNGMIHMQNFDSTQEAYIHQNHDNNRDLTITSNQVTSGTPTKGITFKTQGSDRMRIGADGVVDVKSGSLVLSQTNTSSSGYAEAWNQITLGLTGTGNNDCVRFYTWNNHYGGSQRRGWSIKIQNHGSISSYRASWGTTYTTLSGQVEIPEGGRYVVQNGQDGGNSKGIFMWSNTDTAWGIYMAQYGSGKSLGGGYAPNGFHFSAHAVRFRCAKNSNNTHGFVFENHLEECVFSIRCDGRSFAKGAIHAKEYSGGYVWLTSDDRVKFDETSVTDGLVAIRQLQPKRYLKSRELNVRTDNMETEIGLIAQEVFQIPQLKHCVKEESTDDWIHPESISDSSGMLQLNYNDIGVYTIQAVKELDSIVQTQQTLIHDLQTRLAALEAAAQ